MGFSVWSRCHLEPGFTFHPEDGEVMLERLELYKQLELEDVRSRFGGVDTLVRVGGLLVRHCNWVRFLRATDDVTQMNMVARLVNNVPTFKVVRKVFPNGELKVYFETKKCSKRMDLGTQLLNQHTNKAVSNYNNSSAFVGTPFLRVEKHNSCFNVPPRPYDLDNIHYNEQSMSFNNLSHCRRPPFEFLQFPSKDNTFHGSSLNLDTTQTYGLTNDLTRHASLNFSTSGYVSPPSCLHANDDSNLCQPRKRTTDSCFEDMPLDLRMTTKKRRIDPGDNKNMNDDDDDVDGNDENDDANENNSSNDEETDVDVLVDDEEIGMVESPAHEKNSSVRSRTTGGMLKQELDDDEDCDEDVSDDDDVHKTSKPLKVSTTATTILSYSSNSVNITNISKYSLPTSSCMKTFETQASSKSMTYQTASSKTSKTTCSQVEEKKSKKRCKKWLPCEVCGKKFDRPSLLQRHIRTHTGEKPHVCDVCSKAFSTSSSLNTHRRIHSGEKPHVCPVCSKKFTASSNLYYHRLTHKKEKPHKCTECSRSFPTPGDLKNHRYTHTGTWPFSCPMCRKGFTKSSNLRNHMIFHFGPEARQCGKCGEWMRDASIGREGFCGKCFSTSININNNINNKCNINKMDNKCNNPNDKNNVNGKQTPRVKINFSDVESWINK